jgi:hypothetical protein
MATAGARIPTRGTNTEGIQAATKSPVISVGQYSYRSAL